MFKDFIASTKSNSAGNIDFIFHVNAYTDRWIIDTEASQHMTRNLHLFYIPPIKKPNHFVTIPSGKVLIVQGVGEIKISKKLILRNVKFVSEFKVNLIAISKLTLDNDIKVIFDDHCCVF